VDHRAGSTGKVTGLIKTDGMLDPQGFEVPEPAEAPEAQELFTIRKRDVGMLRTILPEFLQVYRKNVEGNLVDEYEPNCQGVTHPPR
jgi:hypothetical protein